MTYPTLDRRKFLGLSAASAALLATPPAVFADDMFFAGPSLKSLAKEKGLLFGSAIKSKQVGMARIRELFLAECDIVVAENAFKWKPIEPKPGKFRFDPADKIAEFAAQNDLYLRGHTLCWNQDNRVPQWFLEAEPHLPDNKGLVVAKFLRDYIEKMTTRYPSVKSWDVVNEAVQLQDGEIRDSFFTRTIGESFSDVAFEAAAEFAPNADLAYNDYMSWNTRPDHRNGVINYLEGLLARGVRVDTLGIQAHLGPAVGDVDEKSWERFMQRIKDMGLNVVITELDCSDRNIKAASVEKRDAETAAQVKAFLDLSLSFDNVSQVVLWGLTDRESYVRSERYPEPRRRKDKRPMRPHPYNDRLQPKPMREAIAGAFRAAPTR